MVGKRNKIVYALIFAFLLVIPSVISVDILDQILRPFKGINIGQTYTNYAAFIDAIIYFWLFIGLSKTVLGEKVFPNSKTVPTAMGLILAIGMCVFEYKSQFNLGTLAPLAALFFFAIFGVAIYKWTKELGGDEKGSTLLAFSLAFIIIYSVANWAAPDFIRWMQQTEWIGTILAVLFIVAIVGLISGVISLFGSIKSGSWTIGRSAADSERAGRAYKNEDQKATNAMKKEQAAAKKIANLNNELQNINRNINQASEIETNIHNADLANREEQIKVLAELGNAINGSWKLQTQLQQASQNASKPEYANNPQFNETVQNASNQLQELVNKINLLLTKLHDGVKRTTDNQIKEDEAEGILKERIANLEASINQYDQAILEIKQQISKHKASNDPEDERVLEIIQQMIEDRKQLFMQLKSNTERLRIVREAIRKDDIDNLRDLEQAITVSVSDATQGLSKLSRGFNAASNYTSKAQTSESKFMPGLVNSVGDILNVWYNYIQSGSLRQIYQSISKVHARLQQYLATLNTEERNSITSRNDLIKKITTSHANSDAILENKIQTRIIALKNNINNNINYLKDFSEHLGAWIPAVMPLNGMKTEDKKNRLGSIPAHPSRINNENLLYRQLVNYHNVFDTLADESFKLGLQAELKHAKKILDHFIENKTNTAVMTSKSINDIQYDEFRSGFEKIIRQIADNISREASKLPILEDFMRIDNVLRSEVQAETTGTQNTQQQFNIQSQPLQNNMNEINVETEKQMEKNIRKNIYNNPVPQFNILIDGQKVNTVKEDNKTHTLSVYNEDKESIIYEIDSKYIIPNNLSSKYVKKQIKLAPKKTHNIQFKYDLGKAAKGALLVYVMPVSNPKSSITTQIIITK